MTLTVQSDKHEFTIPNVLDYSYSDKEQILFCKIENLEPRDRYDYCFFQEFTKIVKILFIQ